MIISQKNKIVFIAIPKTGTRSIYRALIDNYDGIQWKVDHYRDIPEWCKGYYTFTVVRNPYERLVSAWWSTTQRGGKLKKAYINHLKDDLSLLNYCQNLKKFTYWHSQPQVIWLKNNRFDKIIRFENLKEEWLNLPFNTTGTELPHINTTTWISPNNPTARNPYQEYLTPDIIEIINDYYKEDFDMLKYQML